MCLSLSGCIYFLLNSDKQVELIVELFSDFSLEISRYLGADYGVNEKALWVRLPARLSNCMMPILYAAVSHVHDRRRQDGQKRKTCRH